MCPFGLQDIHHPKLSTAAGFVKKLHDLAGKLKFELSLIAMAKNIKLTLTALATGGFFPPLVVFQSIVFGNLINYC